MYRMPDTRKVFHWIWIVAVVLAMAGCGTTYGIYHKVGKGETLWRIAQTYHADLQQIAELNDIQDPTKIWVGQKIFVPGASFQKKIRLPGELDKKVNISHSKTPVPKNPSKTLKLYKGKFLWPVRGRVSSNFGVRNGRKHDGIDISASSGTPVKAAASGRVAYSDNKIRGYGNLIIVAHSNGFNTVYAHNQVNLVRKGEKVERGQLIAKVGETGRASGPHLHFEIRDGRKPRNPRFFLP